MALPEPSSVCEAWPVEWCNDVTTYDENTVDAAVEAASRVLWSLTGRRFGICTVVQGPPPGQSYCGLPPSRFTVWPDTNPGTALWIDGENPSVDAEQEAHMELMNVAGRAWRAVARLSPDMIVGTASPFTVAGGCGFIDIPVFVDGDEWC